MQDGTAFVGRIIRIDDQTFSMQPHNDPQVTAIFYSQVSRLETGPSGSSNGYFWGLVAAGAAGVVTLAVVGFHEVNKHSQLPTLTVR